MFDLAHRCRPAGLYYSIDFESHAIHVDNMRGTDKVRRLALAEASNPYAPVMKTSSPAKSPLFYNHELQEGSHKTDRPRES